MKKLMILTTILMALGISTACADNDKPIAVTQLPQKAQLFIKAHFPKEKIALAKLERDFLETRYEVVFTNGSKVEFLCPSRRRGTGGRRCLPPRAENHRRF